MQTITIIIPGIPVSKQSVRFSPKRYFQNGVHWCSYCNHNALHKAGDVVTFKNKLSGRVDVIVQAYQDSKYARLDKAIRMLVKQQLPKGFVMFEKEVHIDSADFIFPCLSTFSKKKMQAIEQGEIVFKNTRSDLHDNLKKNLYDALTSLVWKDDSLIVEENKTRKRFGITPMTILTITGE